MDNERSGSPTELSDDVLAAVSGGVDEKGAVEMPPATDELAKGKGKPGKGVLQ